MVLRVAVDARRYQFDGIGRTTSLLIEALAADQAVELVVLAPEGRPGLLSDGGEVVPFPYPVISDAACDELPRYLTDHRIDVLVGPQWYAMLPVPCPMVAFLHDAAPFDGSTPLPLWQDFMGAFGEASVRRVIGELSPYIPPSVEAFGSTVELYRAMYNALVGRSERVLTVLQTARAAIARHLPSARGKLSVVSLFVAGSLTSAAGELPVAVPERFFLHVGKWEPRKRQLYLLDALEYATRTAPEIHLVLIGNRFDFYAAYAEEVGQRVARLTAAGLVTWLPDVSDTVLGEAYRRAVATVISSEFEGFGIPAIEAMAFGTPLIATRGGAIEEICGGAAMLVEDDPRDLAAALSDVWRYDRIRREYQELARLRSRFFSRQRFAAGVHRALRDAAAIRTAR